MKEALKERLIYATKLFHEAMAAHLEWKKSKRGRNYLKKHPVTTKYILETLKKNRLTHDRH